MRLGVVGSGCCALWLFTVLVSGCGPRRAADNGVAPDPNEPTPLTVRNDNLMDAIVFVYHDGQATRVGTGDMRLSSANFMLAPWLLGPTRNINLAAHPIGSPTSINTELIHVQVGQFIEWRLASDLATSSVSVY
jgi:hypothetical protein